MVLLWTALSFTVPSKVLSGVPRKLVSPLAWDSTSLHHWTVIKTLLCGLIGLPPSNGVLPQSPMHTKSMAVLKKQLIRRKMVKSAKESIKQKASKSEIYGNLQAVFIKMNSTQDGLKDSRLNLIWAIHNSGGKRICILYVHVPTATIPIKSVAGEHQVQEHRENEEQGMRNILNDYLIICRRIGVEAENCILLIRIALKKGL
ncbi:probable boron transporter 6 isoform X2 [Arachis hypogaea]|uniref:probable boron transporter 6 isoform X2 n=1 Tax=Arachis hypogaea TaxID=3818 RepID=UPI000DEC4508|nr:probable boron transporter 6 isoform X2 [Arachis hypogaea]